MTRVHGGAANRMYRLDTDQGSFAVKEINVSDRRATYHFDDVFRFEKTAFAAGIPMPEPISADRDALIHRWVDGEKVPEAPVSEAFGSEVGTILARLHSLDVGWDPPTVEEEVWTDWPELAERARETRQPWADDLAAQVPTLVDISRYAGDVHQPGPVVLTHRDIRPWNLLAQGGHPVILDWELSGKIDLSGELGATALSISKRPGLDTIEPAIFRSVLDGYVAGGGTLPPPGPSWFVYLLSGWLGHTRWNVLRCLNGTGETTGPDLELSHDVVRDGIHGLPEMFAQLPDLESLLERQ